MLQNSKVTAFIASELLNDNQQVGGKITGWGVTLPPLPRSCVNVPKLLLFDISQSNSFDCKTCFKKV